jgi:pimeloyl-ACP methyl ester carboxylesterase
VPETGKLVLVSGARVSYRCQGTGTPSILLEAGTDSGGVMAFPRSFTEPLSAVTRVCTYDRQGTGTSDPAARRRHTLSDQCAVQDQVITGLHLAKPYVLVGASGGGNLDVGCAAGHPDQVAGLVTVDSYHDDPADLRHDGLVWTANPEFVDYVDQARQLDHLRTPVGAFPLLVFTAAQADPGGPQNQSYWLALTPHSRQIVVDGQHDLPSINPDPLVQGILTMLHDLRR